MEKSETHIHLIRHGEVHNPRKIVYGRLPRFGLTPKGLDQARQTAGYLATLDLAAVFSSPLLRARKTAAAIAKHYPGLKVHISQYLNEVHTNFEGRLGSELDARRGDLYTSASPESEQPRDIVNRLEICIGKILRRYPGRHVAAVTHGDVITFGVVRALGAELIPRNKTRLTQLGYPVPYPTHCSVTTLTYEKPIPDCRLRIAYHQPWVKAGK
jgi:probable phosphoglycerate mutase